MSEKSEAQKKLEMLELGQTGVPEIDQAVKLYKLMYSLWLEGYDLISTVAQKAETRTLTQPVMADLGFVLRESAKLLDELRKEVQGRQTLIDRILCEDMTKKLLEDPENAPVEVEGFFTTSTPKIGRIAASPTTNDPEFVKYLNQLGFDDKMIQASIVKVDWEKLTGFVTHLASEGKEVPPFIKKVYPRHEMTHRAKKGTLFSKSKAKKDKAETDDEE